jgi:hypothetical protein
LAGGLHGVLNDPLTVTLPAVVLVCHNIFDEREWASAAREIGTNDEHAGADAGTIHVANEDRCPGLAQDAGQGMARSGFGGPGRVVGIELAVKLTQAPKVGHFGGSNRDIVHEMPSAMHQMP